jgi:hypothetical protein
MLRRSITLGRRVLHWLALASPWKLLFVYFGAIVAFGILYTIFRRDFYHPYVKYELPVVEDKHQLGEALSSAFENQFKKKPELGDGVEFSLVQGPVRITGEQDLKLLCSAAFIVERWRPGWPQGPYDTAAMISLSSPPNGPFGRAALALFLCHERGHRSIHFQSIPLLISAWPGLGERIDERGRPVGIDVKVDVDRRAEETNMLGNDPEDRETALRVMRRAVERVRLAPELRRQVDAYTQAERGFPHSTTGTFFRMLYLSWITITTVGYGDIVPMTPWARFFVGVEATFGIILLGLLVNSIVSAASEVRKAEGGKGGKAQRDSPHSSPPDHPH